MGNVVLLKRRFRRDFSIVNAVSLLFELLDALVNVDVSDYVVLVVICVTTLPSFASLLRQRLTSHMSVDVMMS